LDLFVICFDGSFSKPLDLDEMKELEEEMQKAALQPLERESNLLEKLTDGKLSIFFCFTNFHKN